MVLEIPWKFLSFMVGVFLGKVNDLGNPSLLKICFKFYVIFVLFLLFLFIYWSLFLILFQLFEKLNVLLSIEPTC